MDTIHDAIPSINGSASKNEREYPGWTQRATALFLEFQRTALVPFTVEDIRGQNPEFDAVTPRISGWGAIPLSLQRQSFTTKIGFRTHDNDGRQLRHDLGLWWRPNETFSADFVESVGYVIVGGDEHVTAAIRLLKKMVPVGRKLVFDAMLEMEVPL